VNTRTSLRAGLVVALLAASATLSGCSLFAAPLAEHANEATELSARVDLSNAAIGMESFAVVNNGAYPTRASDLTDYGYRPRAGMSEVRILVARDGTTYCLSVTTESGDVFKLTPSSNDGVGECTSADVS
jgi:hypothetical protein